MYSNGELFMPSRECYILVLFPEWHSNEGNKHQNNTRMTEKIVRRESTEIISFLAWHNEAINDEKIDDLHPSTPCLTHSVYILLMTSQSIADDVTMTKQLWYERVNNGILFVRYRFYSLR